LNLLNVRSSLDDLRCSVLFDGCCYSSTSRRFRSNPALHRPVAYNPVFKDRLGSHLPKGGAVVSRLILSVNFFLHPFEEFFDPSPGWRKPSLPGLVPLVNKFFQDSVDSSVPIARAATTPWRDQWGTHFVRSTLRATSGSTCPREARICRLGSPNPRESPHPSAPAEHRAARRGEPGFSPFPPHVNFLFGTRSLFFKS